MNKVDLCLLLPLCVLYEMQNQIFQQLVQERSSISCLYNMCVEIWNLKAKCGYIKNVQAIFIKEYKSFEQVYGSPKYTST